VPCALFLDPLPLGFLPCSLPLTGLTSLSCG